MVGDFPVTNNGKIDRKQLLQDHQNQNSTVEVSNYQSPRNGIEEMLYVIWSDVFQSNKFDISTDFIDLGGHSLMAIQLLSRINETFQLEMPLNTIFEYPNIAAYAVLVDKTITRLLSEEEQ